ncbi:ABC transporter permease [Neomegalonema sp.]|uniref:ABC transporter permease n=1 Tax=Neomegalonema sp. TaxID=2039713 RepID=UPI00262B5D0D|nr:ABC transporter permease [Neomegalonema sp.]MDD2868201.1 ABC transporter permease [Neomegalonema sp.]
MGEMARFYGRFLTGLILALVAFWFLALILMPQISMIQRAFHYEARDGAAAQAVLEANRLQQRVATMNFDIRALEREVAAGVSGAAPAAPSPSNPFAGLPSPGAPRPGLPTPGLTPSPGGASAEAPEARLERLRAERDGLTETIAESRATAQRLRAEEAAAQGWSLRNFTLMSPLHWRIFGLTLVYALCVTALSFLVCYPIAYAAAQAKTPRRTALLLLALTIPYALNELLRIFAWTMILANQGLLNHALDALGIIDLSQGGAIRWLASNGSVFLVMVYTYMLFMVFPIYGSLETLDRNQIEAARDLGASSWRIHWRVALPHARPGVAVGAIMTFMLAVGSLSVPQLVGPGLHPDWFSQIVNRNFFESNSWNVGSAQALLLLVSCTIFIFLVMRVFRVGIREIAR